MTLFKRIFFAFNKRERIIFLAALTGLIISGVTLVGLGLAESTQTVPASGGDFTEGIVGQPIYINPIIAASETDKGLVRLIFSNIYDLSDKMDASSDGRVWKIRLKENLHWQDGEKLTSDDIVFTIQKIQDRETVSPLFSAWQGVATERSSELELQLSLVNPYAFFSDTLKTLYILPKHLFAEVPAPNWRLSDYNLKPVGSGPYKFTSYEKRPDGFIYLYELTSWDKYFATKPLIQNFDFRFFTQTDELIKNFNSGQIDGVAGLEPTDLIQIKRPYEIFPLRLSNYYAIFFNQSKSVPLKDIAVRKALSLAINRDNLVNAALGGHGKPAFGPIPEGTKYFYSEVSASSTSLETASSSLDQAGWKMNKDGFREKTINTTKIPLELNLVVPQIDFLTKTADLLKEAWGKIGFRVNLRAQSPEEVSTVTIKNRDYESLFFGNVLGRSSDLFSFWHSSERFYPGLNLSLYNNKKADSLIESTRLNTNDESRKGQFRDLENLIIGDYPAVFLYSPDYVYVASKNLHGLDTELIAEPADRFVRASNWYLKTARVLK